MRYWLGNEFDLFSASLSQVPQRAVRLHRFTASASAVTSELGVDSGRLQVPEALRVQLGDAVPWQPDAFYIPLESTLGRQVYHEAGAYYIQEPSAMAVVAALNPQPHERILDLAAAPGGKTTAIGRAMQGRGLLVANEIHPTRVLTLAQNIERTGIPAVIVNEHPDRLAAHWASEFDAILVDAPCSGEGMFRKDPLAAAHWSQDAPAACATRQQDILRAALQMVRPGGRLVYSTCTFNPIENEQIIAWVIKEFDATVEELPLWAGWEPGRPEWAGDEPAVAGARRLWPHNGRGEGHFVALLRLHSSPSQKHSPQWLGTDARNQNHGTSLSSSSDASRAGNRKSDRPAKLNSKRTGQNRDRREQGLPRALETEWLHTASQLLNCPLSSSWSQPILLGNQLFSDETSGLNIEGLRVLRRGIGLGSVAANRYEPHHNLAMAMDPNCARAVYTVNEQEALAYLAGESLPETTYRGFTLITFEGLALGWGKSVPGRINNLYPKGLRRTDLLPSPL